MVFILLHVEQDLADLVDLLVIPWKPRNLNRLLLLQQHAFLSQVRCDSGKVDVGVALVGDIDAISLGLTFEDVFLVSTSITQVNPELSKLFADVPESARLVRGDGRAIYIK